MKIFENKSKNSISNMRWNCAYHQGQKITNFCLSEQCLLPLCPQCVKLHLEQHCKANVHGNFQVIDTVAQNILQQLQQKLIQNSKTKQSIQNLQQSKNCELSNILQSLKLYKQNLIKIINNIFKQLQDQIIISISQQQKQSNNQINKTLTLLNNYNQSCKKIINNLPTQTGIENIIYHFTQLKKKNLTLEQQYKKIQELSIKKSTITINQSSFRKITQIIEESVEVSTINVPVLDFNNINLSYTQLTQQDLFKENINKVNISQLNGSTPIFQQCSDNKLEESLIARITKTTTQLQNDINALKKSGQREVTFY